MTAHSRTRFQLPTVAGQRGFSLVELMIAMVVGLMLVAVVTTVYMGAVSNSADTVALTRLNHELQAVVDLVASDTRRTGYRPNAAGGGVNPFDIAIPDPDNPSCVLFSYDTNDNGVLENVDRFGFRYNDVDKTAQFGQQATACDAGTWIDINDPSGVEITALTFSLANSRCANVTAGNDCNAVAPSAGDLLVTVRQLDIEVQGRLARQINNVTVQRTLQTAVTLRNDVGVAHGS